MHKLGFKVNVSPGAEKHFRLGIPFFCIFFLSLFGNTHAQSDLVNRLEAKLHRLEGREKIIVLDSLAWEYSGRDPQKGIAHSENALTLAKKMKNDTLVASVYNVMGVCYHRMGKYSDAMLCYENSLELRRANKDKRGIASSLSKIAVILQERGEYEDALRLQLEVLQVFRDLQEQRAVGLTLNNLAFIHEKQKQYVKALGFAMEALDIFEALGFKYGMASAQGNISVYHETLGNYKKALESNERALTLFQELGIQTDVATCYSNFGKYYRQLGENEKGLNYYKKALAIYRRIGDIHGTAHCLANMASTFTDLKAYKRADAYYDTTLSLAVSEGINPVIMRVHKGKAEVYEKMGKPTKALQHEKKYIAIRDSIYDAEKLELITQMQTKYETERKESEIDQLTNQKRINELEIKQQRSQIFGLIGGMALLIMVGALLYGYFRQKQQEALNRQLLEQQELRLKTIVMTQEEERKRIAKDLHDGIVQSLTAIKHLWQRSDSTASQQLSPSNTVEKALKMLDEASSEVRSISHQMMPKMLGEGGLPPAMEDMLSKSLTPVSIRVEFEHYRIKRRFSEEVEIGLYRVAQELVNNVIKHAHASEVSVQLYQTQSHLVMSFEDNGKGFAFDQKKSEGLGLMNIATRVNTINGALNYETAEGQGTRILIRIPLA